MTAMRLRLLRSPIWRQKPFVRFWLGQSISWVGSESRTSICSWPLLCSMPRRARWAVAPWGPRRKSLGLFAGVRVDRVSRQRLLITSELIAAALVVSVPIAYARGPLSSEPRDRYAVLRSPRLVRRPAWNAFLPSVVEPGLPVPREPGSKLCANPSRRRGSSDGCMRAPTYWAR